MFERLKHRATKRLMTRMRTLADAAQATAYCALFDYFHSEKSDSDAEENIRAAKAAAIANYFFGKMSDPVHTKSFGLSGLYKEGISWLQANPRFQELVVQSLRVRNTVEFARTGKAPQIGMSLLESFGSAFPAAPDPESYSALVHNAINLLSPSSQASVRRYFGMEG